MTMETHDYVSQAEHCLMGNYGQRSFMLVRGEGVYVWDANDRRYIDLLSGIGVNNLGHCHPAVTRAIQEQAGRLMHVSNLYLIEPQIALAQLLVAQSPADKVFFCNSGTEAVEAALIVALDQSFHGRTLGALSVTGQAKYHTGFQPLIPGVKHVAARDIHAMREAVDETVCAVILEPVQGEGGIFPCPDDYLRQVRALCDEKDVLLIFDEIQCGLGRTGHLFASEEMGVEPDMITLAKSLGGGFPIGAMLAKEPCAKALTPGTHASTFGGNPLACAAGYAALTTIIQERLPERSKCLGSEFMQKLADLQEKYACIKEIRGKGLMIGVQFDFPVAEILGAVQDQGYLCGPAGPNVLRFLPPLIIEEHLLFGVIDVLDSILSQKK